MKCTNCGRELSGAKFCALCGTAAPAPEAPAPAFEAPTPAFEAPTPASEAPAPTFEAPMPPPIPPKYVTEANIPPTYRPIGAWAYYGLQLLFSIPFVGFICLIVFSFDDSNINRRNFARSYWCALLIQVILIVLVVVLVLVLGLNEDIVEQIQTLPAFS